MISPKVIIFIATVLAAVGAGWWMASLNKPTSATIEITGMDIGLVAPGEQVTHYLTVNNQSAGILAIEKVVSSCGCTVPQAWPSEIAPYSSVDVPVQVDVPRDKKEFRAELLVHSNDPLDPTYLVELFGRIDAVIALSTATVYTGQVHGNKTIEQAIEVWYRDSGTNQLIVDSDSDLVKPVLIADSERQWVDLQLYPQRGLPGRFSVNLSVYPDSRPDEGVRILVTGINKRGVAISPDQLFFGNATKETLRSIEIEVLDIDWEDVSVSADSDIIKLRPLKRIDESRLLLEVSLDIERSPHIVNSSVILRNGQDEQLSIPVLALIKEGAEKGIREP